MSGKEVDARGLTCPHPVIETNKVLQELDKGTIVTILLPLTKKNNVTEKNINN